MPTSIIGSTVRLDTRVVAYTAQAVSGTTTISATGSNGGTKCVISVEDADIRFTDDGSTTPVEATDNTRRGRPVSVGSEIATDAPGRLKIIARSGSPFLSIEWHE